MAFVEFRDVRKVYTMGEVKVAAVDGMTFDIEQGELVVVVGPSGSGKTTLLNMLGGMDSCTSGSIKLDGREISQFSAKELTDYRRYDIGFVFQFYNLVQNLTALENVELASQICKDPLPAADVLAQVGLAHRMDNFPAQLSGGEQQRVGEKSQASALRRAHGRARLQNGQGHSEIAAGHLRANWAHRRLDHAQFRIHGNCRSRYSYQGGQGGGHGTQRASYFRRNRGVVSHEKRV